MRVVVPLLVARQLESEGVEVVNMEHPAVSSLPPLLFDTPFQLPIRVDSAASRKVHVRGPPASV